MQAWVMWLASARKAMRLGAQTDPRIFPDTRCDRFSLPSKKAGTVSLLRLVGTILIGLVLSTSAASLVDAAAARVEHPTN